MQMQGISDLVSIQTSLDLIQFCLCEQSLSFFYSHLLNIFIFGTVFRQLCNASKIVAYT